MERAEREIISDINAMYADDKYSFKMIDDEDELKSASTDEEIRKKIDNKVKKAYNTLENANKYVALNERYRFSNKSNVHVLNEKYIGESGNPKITMSFEHFLAICLDTHVRGITVGTYLKQRKKNIIEHPKTHFDNNELDLY